MSKEAKPIAVVYYCVEYGAHPEKIQLALDDRWPDYHVIVVPVQDQGRPIELDVYYDKDFTDTNYDDLKKWITDYLTPTTDNTQP